MKISIDDKEFLVLSETLKNVIKNDIHEDEFEEDMRRRLQWVLMQKYEQCLERLKKEWLPKLIAAGTKSIPTDDQELAELIFSHPAYKSRKARDLDEKLI